jgi:hypothetical protein
MSRIAKSDVNAALRKAAKNVVEAGGDDGRTSRAEMKEKLRELDGAEKGLTDLLFRFTDHRDFKAGAQVTKKDLARAVTYAKEHMVAKYDLNNNGLSGTEIKEMSLTGRLAVNLAKALKEAGAATKAERSNGLPQTVRKALSSGFEGIATRIKEIQSTMMRARMTPEGSERLDRELGVLRTMQGGASAVDKRIGEIQRTMMLARMTADGSRRLSAELDALQAAQVGFRVFTDEAAVLIQRSTVARLTPEADRAITARVTTYETFAEGASAVQSKLKEIKKALTTARMGAHTSKTLQLTQAALKAANGGLPTLDARIKEIRSLMTRAMMTPEISESMTAELAVMESVAKTFRKIA